MTGALQRRHDERDVVSNHQPHDCLLKRLFRRRSKKTPKLRVTGLCEGNSPVTGEFPAQRASNAENASIWWRHNGIPFAKGQVWVKGWHAMVLPCFLTKTIDQTNIEFMIRASNYSRINLWDVITHPWASYQIRKISGCACAGNASNVFPGHRGLAIPTCTTSRAWHTCRDACRDR